MVRIGDRVVVGGWREFPVHVTRIYRQYTDEKPVDITPEEAAINNAGAYIELDWGPDQKRSHAAVHDEGRTWYRLASTN